MRQWLRACMCQDCSAVPSVILTVVLTQGTSCPNVFQYINAGHGASSARWVPWVPCIVILHVFIELRLK